MVFIEIQSNDVFFSVLLREIEVKMAFFGGIRIVPVFHHKYPRFEYLKKLE